jgi:hypothetical protein
MDTIDGRGQKKAGAVRRLNPSKPMGQSDRAAPLPGAGIVPTHLT